MLRDLVILVIGWIMWIGVTLIAINFTLQTLFGHGFQ